MRGVVRASVSPQQNQSACPSSSRRNSVDFHLGSTWSVTQRGIRDNTIHDRPATISTPIKQARDLRKTTYEHW